MQLFYGNEQLGKKWLEPLASFCNNLPIKRPPRPKNKRTLVLMCFPAGNINWGPTVCARAHPHTRTRAHTHARTSAAECAK